MVWHYTTGTYLQQILKTRVLRPTGAGIARGERPALWFSKEQYWEPTAQKAWGSPDGSVVLLGMLGTFQRASGLGRIGVDPNRVELCDFETFGATSGIPAADLQAMKHRGRKQGANPRNWLASFAPVPCENWAAVEVYNGTRWMRCNPEN
jgi:hypothetical protein